MISEATLGILREAVRHRYDVPAEQVRFVWAPYRVCPLGAHIDHQLGTVTALAIDRGTVLAYAPAGSPEVRLSSMAYPGEVRFRLDAIPSPQSADWGNYARGAAWALRSTPILQGLVGLTSGDAVEVGLSSSASVGLAYLLALEDVNELKLAPTENIRLDQAIENQYLGLNNGILDQTAILLARRDHLTVIDCKVFAEEAVLENESANIPGVRWMAPSPVLPPFRILIAFSGLTKALVSTDYNRRVSECAEAARLLLRAAGRAEVPARLAEVSEAEFQVHRSVLTGARARRAEHFFSEMRRVRQGISVWEDGISAGLGRLITESGRSSIVNYECGCPPMIDLYKS